MATFRNVSRKRRGFPKVVANPVGPTTTNLASWGTVCNPRRGQVHRRGICFHLALSSYIPRQVKRARSRQTCRERRTRTCCRKRFYFHEDNSSVLLLFSSCTFRSRFVSFLSLSLFSRPRRLSSSYTTRFCLGGSIEKTITNVK